MGPDEPLPPPAPYSSGVGRPRTPVPALACDCHVHLYDPACPVAPDAALTPPPASAQDYRRLQERIGTSRVVFVTPSTYGSDNRCLLQGLAEFGAQACGVAVISGDEDPGELRRLHQAGVRGVRLNLSLGGGPGIENLERLAALAADLGWHLQLLMPADLIVQSAPRLRRLPAPIVFDHFGRVPAQAPWHPARAVVLELLAERRAWIKLSGGYIVSPARTVEDPALDALAQSYLQAAPERVVWGSDWPHASASAGHQPMPDDARQIDRLAQWTAGTPLFEQVLVANSAQLYGF
ncbi:MAG: amidohydrolase family protein [Burkholderiales bacterium]|nr:amidohydrolase family protein [Burkholderiales bacterium]MDE2395307.1 amidohydrolase family protein [Burkholderiales bacterium]MDE2454971.1 amidohydrolase family protein [Burkholderiales bacterium]